MTHQETFGQRYKEMLAENARRQEYYETVVKSRLRNLMKPLWFRVGMVVPGTHVQDSPESELAKLVNERMKVIIEEENEKLRGKT